MGAASAAGNPSFVPASLRKRVNKIEKLLDNLTYLDDPPCALGIFRSCLGAPKMVYSLRCTTPSDESSVILQDFDNLQRTTFEIMLGTVISDKAWKQACLPISKTGVGISQAVDQLKVAFVGSVSQAGALVEQITCEKITDNQIFKQTVEELKNLEISQYTQHKIQEALDDAAFSDLLGNQISNREKARLISLTLPQSGAWLSTPPIPSLGFHLQPNDFRAALKYRIGVLLYIDERKCPYCQNGRLDKLGDHTLSCHGRGDMISRHDRVRDRIFAACSIANLSPVCELKNLIPDNNSRPKDIYLPSWSAGQPSALDVTITSPLQPSLISDAAMRCGFALTNAEDRKYEQYAQKRVEIGIPFVPLLFEFFGGFSDSVRKNFETYSLACR